MESWRGLMEVSQVYPEALAARMGSRLPRGLYHGQDSLLHWVRKPVPRANHPGQVGGQTVSCSVLIRFLFGPRSIIGGLGNLFSHLRAVRSGRRGPTHISLWRIVLYMTKGRQFIELPTFVYGRGDWIRTSDLCVPNAGGTGRKWRK